jgi:hypothetical protein
MNENGGSIPTDSEEWTLHLLYFYLDDHLTVTRILLLTKQLEQNCFYCY